MSEWKIVIGIIIFICIIYYIWREKPFTSTDTLIKSSAGINDQYARTAYRRLKNKEDKTDKELLQQGVLEGFNQERPEAAATTFNRLLTHIAPQVEAGEVNGETEEIIDRIEDFVEELPPHDIGTQYALEDYYAELRNNLRNIAHIAKPVAKQQKKKELTATTKAGKTAEYLMSHKVTPIRDDRQNVHDRQVNKGFRKTYNKIKTTNTVNPQEIKQFIKDNKNIEQKVKKEALNILDKVVSDNTIMGLDGASERQVLHAVWNRINHPSNRGNEQLLKEAFARSIADCKENGSYVCVPGRAERYMSSLATLDADPTMGQVFTVQMMKKKVFKEVNDMFQKEIEAAKNSPNQKLKQVGESYTNPRIVPDEETEKTFVAEVKAKASKYIIDNYKDEVSDTDLEDIKIEAVSAIM